MSRLAPLCSPNPSYPWPIRGIPLFAMKRGWISATAAHCARSIRAGSGFLIPRNLTGLVEPGVGYRRDVDGLRAVAVLSVVFFYAGLKGFNGGVVVRVIFFVVFCDVVAASIV